MLLLFRLVRESCWSLKCSMGRECCCVLLNDTLCSSIYDRHRFVRPVETKMFCFEDARSSDSEMTLGLLLIKRNGQQNQTRTW